MKGPQAQAQMKYVARRLRRPYPPSTYVDAGLTFQEAMLRAYAAYGREQQRLIQQYYVPPTQPPDQPPPGTGTEIPLPPGVGDVVLDDPMTSFRSDVWCRQCGDPKWGLWPGGLPDVNWNDPDNSVSGMGPWGNNWEAFHPDQVSWGPDGCTLTTKRDGRYSDYGYEYIGGIIRSKLVLKNGGFYRVVAQLADGNGGWPGAWALNDAGTAWEPDLVEGGFVPFCAGGDQNTSAAVTFHDAAGAGGPSDMENQARVNVGDFTHTFRTWDMLYRPGESVTMWCDGQQTLHCATSTRTGFCVLVNSSVASPIAASWHTQVDDPSHEFVVRIKRVLLCNLS